MEPHYQFRRATPSDTARCLELIEEAKCYMASLGRVQWDESYPTQADIERDIAEGAAYILTADGSTVAYGAVLFTPEEAYAVIRGAWLDDLPYAVLHRLCVADEARGRGVAQRYLRAVEELARANAIGSVRVDTNHDNAEMLHILRKGGFTHCGEIYYQHGARQAFEKLLAGTR